MEKYNERKATAKELLVKNKGAANVKDALTEMKKLLAIDDKFITANVISSLSSVSSKLTEMDLLASFIAIKASNTKNKVKEIVAALNFSFIREEGEDIKFVPAEGEFVYVKTRGKVKKVAGTANRVDNPGRDSASSYSAVQKYVNNYNLLSEYANGDGYYSGDSITDGFFDLESTAGQTNGDPVIFLKSTYEGGSVARSEEELVDVVGAETAEVGQADIKFKQATLEQGGANILPDQASKVEDLAKTIMAKFAGKTIDGFELLSSASPEYGAIKNEQGWESKYSKITSVGDPGVGTDDATKNMKLAYERGESFMTALNAKLNEMGHPGFAKYQIKWQIASQGGPANDGRFVDLQITTNEKKGTIVKKTDVTGKELKAATSASGASEATLYGYRIQVF
jgi:hypothetical protein